MGTSDINAISSNNTTYYTSVDSVRNDLNVEQVSKVEPTNKPELDKAIANQDETSIAATAEFGPQQSRIAGDMNKPGYIPTVSERTVIKAIEAANRKLSGAYSEFRFSVHEKTKQISIKIIDKTTGDIIREIPPEETLDMVAKLWEMAGILVDEKR